MTMPEWLSRLWRLIASRQPAPPPTPSDFRARMLAEANQLRASAGVGPLLLDPRLCDAADTVCRLDAQEGRLNHSPAGTTLWGRIMATGYRAQAVGENIAQGQPTPEAAVQAWMGDATHRESLLSPDYADVGFGAAGGYWAANFGRQRKW